MDGPDAYNYSLRVRFSFSHGTNDAQKTMGLIFFLLIGTGYFSLSGNPSWSGDSTDLGDFISSCSDCLRDSFWWMGVIKTPGTESRKITAGPWICRRKHQPAGTIIVVPWLHSCQHHPTITGSIIGLISETSEWLSDGGLHAISYGHGY